MYTTHTPGRCVSASDCMRNILRCTRLRSCASIRNSRYSVCVSSSVTNEMQKVILHHIFEQQQGHIRENVHRVITSPPLIIFYCSDSRADLYSYRSVSESKCCCSAEIKAPLPSATPAADVNNATHSDPCTHTHAHAHIHIHTHSSKAHIHTKHDASKHSQLPGAEDTPTVNRCRRHEEKQ